MARLTSTCVGLRKGRLSQARTGRIALKRFSADDEDCQRYLCRRNAGARRGESITFGKVVSIEKYSRIRPLEVHREGHRISDAGYGSL